MAGSEIVNGCWGSSGCDEFDLQHSLTQLLVFRYEALQIE
jgi:hypothetical protein